MAKDQEKALGAPKTLQGPLVHSKPTTLSIFSTKQLTNSPFLPSLLSVINQAFRLSHASKPELGLRSQGERLGSIDEFLAGLQDPESFILIVHPAGTHTVTATASARRYHGPSTTGVATRNTPWERIVPVELGCEEWELKLMVTAPEAQGQGLAAFMMRTVEQEIQSRYEAKAALVEEAKGKRLRVVLCTPRELTGEFYLRRGFTKDYETWRGEGYNFHIVHLSKDIAE